MSSVASPNGAEPVGTLSGSGSFSGKVRHIPIATTYGTQISTGDFVKLVAGGGVEKDTGTATATPVGIFMGCAYTDPSTDQMTFSQYWPAGNLATDAVAYVADDPNLLFRIQSAGSVGAEDRGFNAAIVVTAGNTTFGRSKNAANATPANTATLPLRIIDFVDGPDSSPGDAFTDLICTYNAGHQYGTALGV